MENLHPKAQILLQTMTIISQPELTYSKEHKCHHCTAILKVELKDLFNDPLDFNDPLGRGIPRSAFRCPVCRSKNYGLDTTGHFAASLPKEATEEAADEPTESDTSWSLLWIGMFLSSLLIAILILLSQP